MSPEDESALLPEPGAIDTRTQRPILNRNAPNPWQPSPATATGTSDATVRGGLQPSPVAERVAQQVILMNNEQELRPILTLELLNNERPTLIQDSPELRTSPIAKNLAVTQRSLLQRIEEQHLSPGPRTSIGAPRRGLIDFDTPNFHLGLLGVGLRAGLEFEFNDNVNVADRHLPGDRGPRSDLFIRPRFGIDAVIPISQLNVLTLQLDVGYEFSLNDSRPDASPLTIAPDSELAFDVFIGDVRINLHDRFGIENNGGSRSTVSNANDYTLFTNSSGIYALWNNNDLKITGGYDFTISRFSGSAASERDRDSHILFGSASLLISHIWTVGLEGSFIYSTSGKQFPTEQNSFAIGPFVRLPLTRHTEIQAGIGLQRFDTTSPRDRSRNSDQDELLDPFADFESEGGSNRSVDTLLYWNVSIRNRLNGWFAHTLSAGKERELGIGADYVDLTFVRYRAIWLLFPRFAVQFNTGLEFTKQKDLGFSERATWWTIGVGGEYKITPHLRAGARYGFTLRSSDQPFRDYEQNRLVLSLSYDF